ncbi:hypothetical protein CEXT_464891 [Caerostris extrusa]|uniref:Uncharacterized protein n=1 Tax=Caerostris extrusa TaxID=172846 RepID=A0AAV4Y6R7_CAEEX|nr:hypothetical protein CEXT_464891 [Caerostris extrusa]
MRVKAAFSKPRSLISSAAIFKVKKYFLKKINMFLTSNDGPRDHVRVTRKCTRLEGCRKVELANTWLILIHYIVNLFTYKQLTQDNLDFGLLRVNRRRRMGTIYNGIYLIHDKA